MGNTLHLSDKPPTVDTFWDDDSQDLDPDRSQSVDDLIADAEEHLDIRLPELLKALYRRRNGGCTGYLFYPNKPDPRPILDDWECISADGNIFPVDRLETLSELSDLVDFGDDDVSFSDHFPDPDRLIVLCRHGWDVFLCLDYQGGGPQDEPEIVSIESTDGLDGLAEVLRVPNFETFFAGLRKEE